MIRLTTTNMTSETTNDTTIYIHKYLFVHRNPKSTGSDSSDFGQL